MHKDEKQCGHKFTTTVTVQCDNVDGHEGPCHVPKLPDAYVDGLWLPMKETILEREKDK